MWLISLRDLQFRYRRFLIAIAGAALLFAMTLTLTGMAQGLRTEGRRAVADAKADAWVVPADVSGPFTAVATLPEETVDAVRGMGGVGRADPYVILRDAVRHDDGRRVDVNLLGYRPGGLGRPPLRQGREVREPGEAIVDAKTGLALGDRFVIGGQPFRAVGRTKDRVFNATLATVYIGYGDAQQLAFQGQRLITTVMVKGRPSADALPAGLRVLSNDQVRTDLLRPQQRAIQSLDGARGFCWFVAMVLVGAIVYLSAVDRIRDFAVLKAVGASSTTLFAGLALQAVVVSLGAAGVGIILSRLLIPLYTISIDISTTAMALMPAAAIPTGLLASLAGLRRATGADPAVAFGAAE